MGGSRPQPPLGTGYGRPLCQAALTLTSSCPRSPQLRPPRLRCPPQVLPQRRSPHSFGVHGSSAHARYYGYSAPPVYASAYVYTGAAVGPAYSATGASPGAASRFETLLLAQRSSPWVDQRPSQHCARPVAFSGRPRPSPATGQGACAQSSPPQDCLGGYCVWMGAVLAYAGYGYGRPLCQPAPPLTGPCSDMHCRTSRLCSVCIRGSPAPPAARRGVRGSSAHAGYTGHSSAPACSSVDGYAGAVVGTPASALSALSGMVPHFEGSFLAH